MEPQREERRLTAILSADVVGYSRLMGDDETGTLAALKTHRKELIEPKTTHYGGRVVNFVGDCALLEFASVVDAVRFAVEMQLAMQDRNATIPEDRRIRFRIGINIGDILVDGDDIYGDGVNIAARLEGLADPGGICIARSVFDQVRGKLQLAFENLGERRVKNIVEPVQVFRIPIDAAAQRLQIAASEIAPSRPFRRFEAASLERMAYPLPSKPSIAVLPFANLSGIDDQDYFSDGITDDIITHVSQISSLFVIARGAVIRYKGLAVEPREVSEDLGVRYVLEGSVRRDANRIRVNSQLIDATNGICLWAERYDRGAADVFEVQAEITAKIVDALEVTLTGAEQRRVARRHTDNLEAYDYYQRGRAYLFHFTRDGSSLARQMFKRAIELDPGFAAAHAELSTVQMTGWDFSNGDYEQALQEALGCAQKAVALDRSLPRARMRLGEMYAWTGEFENAISELKSAIELDPNFADAHTRLAMTLDFAGRPEDAIEPARLAVRLSPDYVVAALHLGQVYWHLRRYDSAIATLQDLLRQYPSSIPALRYLAIALSETGRIEEAKAAIGELLRICPGATLEVQRQRIHYKEPEDVERFLSGLKNAGLPE